MEQSKEQLCPSCQTLITWDPDIGPEEECPHCYNKLDAYRTLTVKLSEGEHDKYADEDAADYDSYDEFVRAHIDTQEEAPECPACHEFMLFAGTRAVEADGFVPAVSAVLGKSFLQAPFELHVFVCPSCFRTDSLLAEDGRMQVIRAFRDNE